VDDGKRKDEQKEKPEPVRPKEPDQNKKADPLPPQNEERPKEEKAKTPPAAAISLSDLLDRGKEFFKKNQIENARSTWQKVVEQASVDSKADQVLRADALFWINVLVDGTTPRLSYSGAMSKENFAELRKESSARDQRLIRVLDAWREAGLTQSEVNARRFNLMKEQMQLVRERQKVLTGGR